VLRAGFLVRRLKSEVLKELPPKRRQLLVLPENAVIRKLQKPDAATDALARSVEALLEDAQPNDAAWREGMKGLAKMQRASFHELARMRHDLGVAKVPLVLEVLQTIFESKGGGYRGAALRSRIFFVIGLVNLNST